MVQETKERVIIFSADRCSGCRICELVCSMKHQGEYNPRKSFIRIMANEEAGVYIPVLDIKCDLCNECVEACPLDALGVYDMGEAIITRRNTTIGSFPIPASSRTDT